MTMGLVIIMGGMIGFCCGGYMIAVLGLVVGALVAGKLGL